MLYEFFICDVSELAVTHMCSAKKVFLEILQNAQVVSCEFWEIFKNTSLQRTHAVAASVLHFFLLINWLVLLGENQIGSGKKLFFVKYCSLTFRVKP